MEDIGSSPASPNPLKRAAPEEDTSETKLLNLKGTQFMIPTPPDTEESSPNGSHEQRAGSPAPSTISSLTSMDTVEVSAGAAASGSGTRPPAAKRRKLTPSEKAEEARLKEEKKKEREEKKAKREEEQVAKSEEKRRRAEEKEAKKREKDLEQQRKDEEKAKKEEEKLKKERSQMRLGAFFQKPATTPAKTSSGEANGSVSARRKSLSLEPFDVVANPLRMSASPSKNSAAVAASPAPPPAKPSISDYRKYFLPFQPRAHSSMPKAYVIPNDDDLAYWQGEFDREVKQPHLEEMADLGLCTQPEVSIDELYQFGRGRDVKRGSRAHPMREVVDQIQGTSHQPIDLTREGAVQQPHGLLEAAPRRYIHFDEDVRPAYFGTYSTHIESPKKRKLMRQPFSRGRPDTDYDYDSEAEWEEPEEGEDILGDEEDEAESLGDADEMDGFLDDEDDLKMKRKMITGDLQPTSTGLCWENERNVIVRSIENEVDGLVDEVEGTPAAMHGMRIGFLLPRHVLNSHTIDPFSSAYWAHEMAPPGLPIPDARPPLKERSSNSSPPTSSSLTQMSLPGTKARENGPITTSTQTASTAKRGPKAQPKTLNKEDLEEFKDAVVNSPLGKVELCKGLKTR